MKTEEIMIGDWITGPDLEPRRVVAILNFDEIQVEKEPDSDNWITYNIIEAEPIPLLPWMLEKAGFKPFSKEAHQLFEHEFWVHENEGRGKFKVWHSSGRWFVQHYSRDGLTNVSMPLPTGSVHELQHLLRICGIELDMNIH